MKIVIVSQFFHPEPAITANELSRRLAADGHEVHVVTGFPSRPGGRIYPGYRQCLGQRDLWQGASVHRVPLIINHDRNPLRRIGSFASFALSSLSKTGLVGDADVVYVYATPMTAAVAPRLWRLLLGTPFVLHVQDLWPESVTESGMVGSGATAKAVRTGLDVFLKWLYDGASEVIAIAPTMAKLLAERGVPLERLTVSLNWADETTVTRTERALDDSNAVRFVYAGNVGVFQDLGTLVEAARLLDGQPRIHVDVYGDGTELAELRRQAEGLSNLEFHGRVPREHMNTVYAASDFQLITLRDLPLFRGTIPSKFQGAMAAGIPVVTSVQGDVSELVTEHGLGFAALPEDPADLARAIEEAASTSACQRANMRDRAEQFYLARMSATSGYRGLLGTLQQAAEDRPRRTIRRFRKRGPSQ